MPGTAVQELLRILRSRKRNGEKSIWLSTVNREAMQQLAAGAAGRPVMPARAASVSPVSRPMPGKAQAAVSSAVPSRSAEPSIPISRPMPGSAPAANASPAPAPKQEPVPPAAAAVSSRTASSSLKREPITGDYQSCAGLDYPALETAVANCRKCQLCQQALHSVPGEGVPGARVMFIGGHAGSIAPDTEAGVMLTNIISAMKLQRGGTDPRTGVYVTTILKCSAAGHKLTDSREVESCMGYLLRQIELVHPEYIVLLGALSLRCLLGLVNVQKYHGQWLQYKGIPVLPVYEPEFILRFQNQPSFMMKYKREIWNDLKQVMGKLNSAG